MLRRSREEDQERIVTIRLYDCECTQNTLYTETDRLFHKVNYSIAMSACNKCMDGHPSEDCSQTQTLSGIRGRDAMKFFARGF